MKIKKLLYLLIAVVFIVSSCEKEDNLQRYELGTEFFVSSGSYTSLDDQVTISIANDQKNLSEVTVTHLGGLTTDKDADENLIPFDPPSANLGAITISDGSGAMVVTDTELGMTEIGWSADFQFDATFDGKPIVRYGSLEVTDPISVSDPGVLHKDTTYHFVFEVAPVSATVTSVTVRTKVSEAGTYTNVTGSFDVANDSIPLLGTDYTVGDTIFVEVTANTATKTAVTVTGLVVAPDSYESVASFNLNHSYNQLFSPDDTLAYDMILSKPVLVAAATDSADVKMTFAYADLVGGVDVGLYSDENMEFVKVADEDAASVYANGDILLTEATDFTGAPNSVDILQGEVYIYRTRRGTGAFEYGILLVKSVNVPVGADMMDASIDIEYKYTEQE